MSGGFRRRRPRRNRWGGCGKRTGQRRGNGSRRPQSWDGRRNHCRQRSGSGSRSVSHQMNSCSGNGRSAAAQRIANAALANDVRLSRSACRHSVLHLRTDVRARYAHSRRQVARARVVVHHLCSCRSVHAQRSLARARCARVQSTAKRHDESLPGTRYDATHGVVGRVRVGLARRVHVAERNRRRAHGWDQAGYR